MNGSQHMCAFCFYHVSLTHVSNISSYGRKIIIVTEESFVSSDGAPFWEKMHFCLLIYTHPHPCC